MYVKLRRIFIRKFIKYWLPVIFLMCFIFWMSTETFSSQNTFSWTKIVLRFLVPNISSQEIGLINAFIRKAGHVIEYFILGLLLFRAFRGDFTVSWKWRWSFFAVIVVILWAATDEFHQSFVPTRTASAMDVGIDTAGGMLAQLVSAMWPRYRKKRISTAISVLAFYQ
jgi:VanZ family protein